VHACADCAWLWPFDETERKVGRSWATALAYMDGADCADGYTFAASQAWQFAVCEARYPDLFERLKAAVARKRFIPVGGSWVEFDANMPSGESLVRQLVMGTSYFKEKFGATPKVFWLPDTFGYSSQLPQLLRQCGMPYFLTQKLSWNLVNKFPHTTFWWEGLDGSRVLSHFPPCDTYSASASVAEAHKSVTNHKDRERSPRGLLLIGHGDGGGGPTTDMLERVQRLAAGVPGLPRVQFSSPDDSFMAMEADDAVRPLVTWSGELF
jgi:alpha-mannosidase